MNLHASPEQPTASTFPATAQEASLLLDAYGAALAKGCPGGGIARNESLLPATKGEIIKACKYVLAFLIQKKALTDEFERQIYTIMPAIDQFVPDSKAERINCDKSMSNPEYSAYLQTMTNFQIIADIKTFTDNVYALDPLDTNFVPNVNALIGR